jgi:hypothetical protein
LTAPDLQRAAKAPETTLARCWMTATSISSGPSLPSPSRDLDCSITKLSAAHWDGSSASHCRVGALGIGQFFIEWLY